MAKTVSDSTLQDSVTAPASASARWSQALRGGILLIALCGGLYPLLTVTVSSLLFPHQATGSLIESNGRVVGSELVGQPFRANTYFHGRPSAASYDPFGVSGSNMAPSNPELRERVASDSQALVQANGISEREIPVDMLSASGSGIDPHISPQAAAIQVERVAAARGMAHSEVTALLATHVEQPLYGVLGQPRVNVLKLNLALDEISLR